MRATILSIALMTLSSSVLSSRGEIVWTLVGDETNNPLHSFNSEDLPTRFRLYSFDEHAFKKTLNTSQRPDQNGRIPLPSPEGDFSDFIFWDSEVMHPDLAAEHPEIETFQGYNDAQEVETARFDLNPSGFHAQVLSEKGLYYISPLNRNHYVVYYAKDYRPLHGFNCSSDESPDQDEWENLSARPLINYGTIKRTYRLAVAATGEYTTASGGSAAALSSIVTAVNFINGIYELELNIKLQLIANNGNLIYTNATTDPFTPESGNSSMLSQNQSNTDLVIGAANYDIGHVVHDLSGSSNSGSGVATVTSTCRALLKARGVTSASRIGQTPMNPFFFRVLAHELGHQFGAHHSFNSSCNNNRFNSTAYEPGGGSTIMSYAGGCSPYNVQTLADTYFHRISLEEIATYISGTGGTCAVTTNPGNAIPTADAGASYIIPQSTPFVLTGIGTDANGNTLTYGWEQYNNEIAVMPPSSSSTVGPNFRSFVPSTSPQRYFPRLADILTNVSPIWEVLPTVSRTLNFSLVVRDGVGGASSDDTTVTINSASGPFVVTSPNGGGTFSGNIVVTWNPANTNLAPINTSQVDILLSTNNGNTFPTVLANNTANDGSQSVTLPAISTSQARIQVRAEGNIFFDVSNAPFNITP